MTTERGTFCVVIEKQLITTSCPLPKGVCMWKHRIHGGCTYDAEFANPEPENGKQKYVDPNEYAKRVGLPPIPVDIVNILRQSLVMRVKEELST